MTNMSNWDRRFLEMAKLVSSWSKDQSTRVGAVIVNSDNRIVSLGFNGLPKGIADTDERLKNRELKYNLILHGEVNAILFANCSLVGCTLYTFPFQPCATCSSVIVQCGFSRVVSLKSDNPRWVDSFKLGSEILREANIKLDLYDEMS